MSTAPTYVPSPTPDLAKIERALISVSDKTGPGRARQGAGRARRGDPVDRRLGQGACARPASKVIEVSDHTGFPEIMDGRVKTLQPAIHGGILARRTDTGHAKAMSDHKIAAIDLVVVNLYPFEATVARGADFPTCVENIDIGGPALIRASAKNHDFVTVVVDPADYTSVLDELAAQQGRHDPGAAPQARRQGLCAHRGLRFGDRRLVRQAAGRDLPRAADDRGRARADPALRREPASAGGLLCRRQQAAGRRHRAPGPGQGAVLQQHQRHRGGLRMRGRVRPSRPSS